MSIYFAGSIRGGRQDVAIYQEIIAYLKRYDDVLTEHVGDYRLSVRGQEQLDDQFIHDRDLAWLRQSRLVVAEVTTPSLGVGYEIATAVHWQIPVLAFSKTDDTLHQVSAMVLGAKGVHYDSYQDYSELIDKLSLLLEEVYHG